MDVLKVYDICIMPAKRWPGYEGTECIIDKVGEPSQGMLPEYSVISLVDGNGMSWFMRSELAFVRYGSQKDIDAAAVKRVEIRNRDTDLKYLLGVWHWKYSPSSDTMVYILDQIGYNSNFKKSGEFYVLLQEYGRVGVLICAVMMEGNIFGINFVSQFGIDFKKYKAFARKVKKLRKDQ